MEFASASERSASGAVSGRPTRPSTATGQLYGYLRRQQTVRASVARANCTIAAKALRVTSSQGLASIDMPNAAKPPLPRRVIFSKACAKHCGRMAPAVVILWMLNMGFCHQWLWLQESAMCLHPPLYFTAFFFLEMCLKLIADSSDYFKQGLNILDFGVAWISVIHFWIVPLVMLVAEVPLAILQVLDFLQILRGLKILQLNRELFVLAKSLLTSFRTLVWVLILLFVFVFLYAMIVQDIVQGFMAREYLNRNTGEMEEYVVASVFFPNLVMSMMTLWGMCIGHVWTEVIEPVTWAQPYLVPLFISFFALTSFGLLNVIIGVLTEKTQEAAQQHREAIAARRKSATAALVTGLVDLLDMAEADGVDILTLETFEANESIFKEISRCVKTPGAFTAQELFTMLDVEGRNVIGADEFLIGLFRLIMSDDFQSRCLLNLSFGRVMNRLTDLEEILMQGINETLSLLQGGRAAMLQGSGIGSRSMMSPRRFSTFPRASCAEV